MLSHYKEAFIRLFYPAACEVCHVTLDLAERVLCRACAADLDALAWPLEHTLVDERFEHLDHAWTVYAYRSPLRELLHGVKYSRKDYLLKACRERSLALAQAVTSNHGYDAVLPIPIDRMKHVTRHFNQAEVLAEALKTGLPPIQRSLLIKRHSVLSQTSLSRQERAINVYGAFKLRSPEKARGKTFLLIDDVLTTGATANEAARVLKLRGAKRVDFFALSRTISPAEKNKVQRISFQGPQNEGTRPNLPPHKGAPPQLWKGRRRNGMPNDAREAERAWWPGDFASSTGDSSLRR